jgi:predicted nucleic acid-binding protein
VNLQSALKKAKTVYLDTAPIIYYIEASPQFGPVMKELVDLYRHGGFSLCTSVLTITETIPKPFSEGNKELQQLFLSFFRNRQNIVLHVVSEPIAICAGELRGIYPSLRTMDALQIATAIEAQADLFVTNDAKLKQIKEIPILLLSDHAR